MTPAVTSIDTRRLDVAGSSDRRRRRAPVPLPPGPHAGEEDGQGPDLLAGDLRLHEHQRDADPARPLGVREVREARRRLQHRLAARRDPQDPPDAGTAQHRAHRRGPARPGDRELADLRRARDQHRGRLRHRSGEARAAGRERPRQPTTAASRTRSARRTSSSACSPFRPTARSASPTTSSAAGIKIIFNYSEALLDVPTDVAVHTSNPAVELLYALYFYLT